MNRLKTELLLKALVLLFCRSVLAVQFLADTLEKALVNAARQNDIFLVEQLLAHSLFTTILCQEGDTILHKAAAGSQAEVVRFLLQNSSVAINARNDVGETPLHSAILWGHLSVVQVLLEYPGIDILALSDNNLTPIEYAARFGRTEILKLLIARLNSLSTQLYTSAYALAQNFGHVSTVEFLACYLLHTQLPKQHYITDFKIIEDYMHKK